MTGPSLILRRTILLVILAVAAESVPKRNIVRRQTGPIDTSFIDDNDLLACFGLLAEGKDCSAILPGNPAITAAPPTAVAGCKCVPTWQCRDFDNPSVDTPDGGILTLVNVRTTCGDPFDTCCINIDLNAQSPVVSPTPRTPSCGQMNPAGVGNTLLGFEERQSQFGQFPWMAAVMTTGIAGADGANIYVCGASLIHPKIVLTAAHYMQDKSAAQLAVRLGEWNFKLPTEPILHQDIRVQRIERHPQFVPITLQYDVALLFLERDAVLGPTVSPICLPSPFETFDDNNCFSSGWGKDIFGQTGRYQQILKSIQLPAINHAKCEAALLSKTHLGNPTRQTPFTLHPTFMCAGGVGGIDTCTGDGGSPLVCPKKTNPPGFVQAGIVAWGIGCGQDGVPGVYASVSQAVPWIGKMIGTSNFDVRGGGT